MEDRTSPAQLLIADDHVLVREGTRAMLKREPDLEVVGEAQNGREALEMCRSLRPDLVLMDVRMPVMDGLTATRGIKAECPKTAVLIVTSHESEDHLLDAIRAGAAGYVLKEATRQQLIDAVRGVLGGESPLNQELAMQLLQRLAGEDEPRTEPRTEPWTEPPVSPKPTKRRRKPPPGQPLTARELDVLGLLASGKTNRQIAEELHLSLSTVKGHVERTIAKLEVSDRTQAAVKALELGLIELDQEEEK